MVLQAVALHVHGEKKEAVHVLGDALASAKPNGFVRIFVDEGTPMAGLLYEALAHGVEPGTGSCQTNATQTLIQVNQ